MVPTPPPRLHVLFRPEQGHAVVIRRGPSRAFCTIGWDVTRDAFVVGQWCKHRLYPHRCDLSADGVWMVYFALNGRWSSEVRGAFTALSRAPYLRAVRIWAAGHTWGGGGVFYARPDELGPDPSRRFDQLPAVDPRNRLGTGRYADRLRRDGWVRVPRRTSGDRAATWEKALGAGLLLRKTVVDEAEHHAIQEPDGSVWDRRTWDWADHDLPRDRLVWTEGGVLHAAALRTGRLGEPRVLRDFRGMTFEPLAAPYGGEPILEDQPWVWPDRTD